MKLIRVAAPLFLVALLGTNPVAQSPVATGTLAGCVIDISGGALPGVSVEISGNNVERGLRTGEDGCYSAQDLPAGVYSVSTHLQGFQTVRQARLTVTPRETTRHDATMRIGCISEVIILSLQDAWKAADTVVRVRIEDGPEDHSFGPGTPPPPRNRAIVVNVFKSEPLPLTEGSSLSVVRFQFDDLNSYVNGQESILFLRWNAAKSTYFRIHMGCTPLAFTIHGRQISNSGVLGYKGTTLDGLIADLRGLRSPR